MIPDERRNMDDEQHRNRETAQDTEGLQTMRTLANNMAVMLKMYATGKAEMPEAEEWQPMHFIR